MRGRSSTTTITVAIIIIALAWIWSYSTTIDSNRDAAACSGDELRRVRDVATVVHPRMREYATEMKEAVEAFATYPQVALEDADYLQLLMRIQRIVDDANMFVSELGCNRARLDEARSSACYAQLSAHIDAQLSLHEALERRANAIQSHINNALDTTTTLWSQNNALERISLRLTLKRAAHLLNDDHIASLQSSSYSMTIILFSAAVISAITGAYFFMKTRRNALRADVSESESEPELSPSPLKPKTPTPESTPKQEAQKKLYQDYIDKNPSLQQYFTQYEEKNDASKIECMIQLESGAEIDTDVLIDIYSQYPLLTHIKQPFIRLSAIKHEKSTCEEKMSDEVNNKYIEIVRKLYDLQKYTDYYSKVVDNVAMWVICFIKNTNDVRAIYRVAHETAVMSKCRDKIEEKLKSMYADNTKLLYRFCVVTKEIKASVLNIEQEKITDLKQVITSKQNFFNYDPDSIPYTIYVLYDKYQPTFDIHTIHYATCETRKDHPCAELTMDIGNNIVALMTKFDDKQQITTLYTSLYPVEIPDKARYLRHYIKHERDFTPIIESYYAYHSSNSEQIIRDSIISSYLPLIQASISEFRKREEMKDVTKGITKIMEENKRNSRDERKETTVIHMYLQLFMLGMNIDERTRTINSINSIGDSVYYAICRTIKMPKYTIENYQKEACRIVPSNITEHYATMKTLLEKYKDYAALILYVTIQVTNGKLCTSSFEQDIIDIFVDTAKEITNNELKIEEDTLSQIDALLTGIVAKNDCDATPIKAAIDIVSSMELFGKKAGEAWTLPYTLYKSQHCLSNNEQIQHATILSQIKSLTSSSFTSQYNDYSKLCAAIDATITEYQGLLADTGFAQMDIKDNDAKLLEFAAIYHANAVYEIYYDDDVIFKPKPVEPFITARKATSEEDLKGWKDRLVLNKQWYMEKGCSEEQSEKIIGDIKKIFQEVLDKLKKSVKLLKNKSVEDVLRELSLTSDNISHYIKNKLDVQQSKIVIEPIENTMKKYRKVLESVAQYMKTLEELGVDVDEEVRVKYDEHHKKLQEYEQRIAALPK